MIDLARRSEPYEIALPYGLSVTVKPLTTAGMATAQAAARRAVEAIERQVRERTEAGLALDGLPDLSAEGERDGFYQAQLIRELAVRHVASWTGVELGGGPAPPTPENIAAVMELVWGSFCQAPRSGAASPFRAFSARAAQSRWRRVGYDDLRGAHLSGATPSRHTLVFGRSMPDLNHDAAMRIGGEAPGGGPNLYLGLEAMLHLGFTATSDRH